jgi:hypothetical protein
LWARAWGRMGKGTLCGWWAKTKGRQHSATRG